MKLEELVTAASTEIGFYLLLSALDVSGAFDGTLVVGNLQIYSYDSLTAGCIYHTPDPPAGKGWRLLDTVLSRRVMRELEWDV